MTLETIKAWLPAAIALITLIGGAFVYQVQRSVDRDNQLRSERRDLYRKFVTSFNSLNAHVLQKHADQGLSEYIVLKGLEAEIIVCAPDDVVLALKNLTGSIGGYAKSQVRDENEKGTIAQSVRAEYERVVLAMRNDVFGKTSINRSIVAEFTKGLGASIGRFPL